MDALSEDKRFSASLVYTIHLQKSDKQLYYPLHVGISILKDKGTGEHELDYHIHKA